MQAILIADYSFTPIEFWRGISQSAREFIKRCLTVDPVQRMTSHQALQHPWIKVLDPLSPQQQNRGPHGHGEEDLLPVVKKNFNARRTLHKAIDTVRAINKLREGGGLMMDGAMSVDPRPKQEMVNGSQVTSGDDGGQPMEGVAQGSQQSEADAEAEADGKGGSTPRPGASGNGQHPVAADEMDIDGRGDARGQTRDQIWVQEKKVKETVMGLWSRR